MEANCFFASSMSFNLLFILLPIIFTNTLDSNFRKKSTTYIQLRLSANYLIIIFFGH